jgi:Phage terminase, small subunit
VHRLLHPLRALHEPRYEPGLPPKPKRMSAPAKRIWDDLVDEMAGAAVLGRVESRALWQLAEDEALLEHVYSGLWKMARMLRNQAAKEGKELPAGEIMALLGMKSGRLVMATIRDLAARVIVERREFGLTPSSRSRVEVVDQGTAMDTLEMKLCG